MYKDTAAQEKLPLLLYVLRLHTDDRHYTTQDVDSRDLEVVKKQALTAMIEDDTINMVKLVGLGLGKHPVEGVTWTRHDAFPWYVDHREREKDPPIIEHFADKKAAQRRYRDYLQQDLLVSSNAVG